MSIIFFCKKTKIFFAVILLVSLGILVEGKNRDFSPTVTVTVLQTTDVHGRIFPWDYFKDRQANVGLARIATYVKEVRKRNRNVLLLDDGDTIQGTPLTYYFERRDPNKPNPMMLIMNYMHYDAMTVGNHEYNYGLDVLEKCRHEARFPFLSANTYYKDSGVSYFNPYIIKEFQGVRIGIIGLTTSNIPNWETPANYKGLIFRPTPDEAKKWVKILRDKEHVDAVIINTHEGFEVNIDTGEPNGTSYENQAWKILQTVHGIDVLLTGHTHKNIPPRIINGVLVSQGHCWGQHVTNIKLVFQKKGSHWLLIKKYGQNVKMDSTYPADPKVVSLALPYHRTVLKWIHSKIGTAMGTFTTYNVYTDDNPLMDLLHTVMRRHVNAQMSMASYLPHRFIKIKKGPITIKDIYSFYIYENTIVELEIKGVDIKKALEHSAEFYDRLQWDPVSKLLRIFQAPKFRSYNFDTLSGATYVIDPTRPIGNRVRYLEINGHPIEMDKKYTLAVTNYQAAGGGHFKTFKKGKIISTDSSDIRNLLIEYILQQKKIYPVCDHNWHLSLPTRIVFPKYK